MLGDFWLSVSHCKQLTYLFTKLKFLTLISSNINLYLLESCKISFKQISWNTYEIALQVNITVVNLVILFLLSTEKTIFILSLFFII